MTVTFRVDASTRIGTGHVMRCLTLASALRDRGMSAHFACREHEGHLMPLLRERGFAVTPLKAPRAAASTDALYASWLGVSQVEDAEETVRALTGGKADWVIVDHYALDAEWEVRVRPYAGRILVITDLQDRAHVCDLLLDQNDPASEARLRSSALVPESCALLTGPRFALLAPEYPARRQRMRDRDGRLRRVLVFFGGSDPDNAAGVALEALSRDELGFLEVDLVLGPNSPHRAALERVAAARPRTTVHRALPHLADLVERADLALGAGGATTWERMCLGLPAVVVSIAENQRPACEALASSGHILYLGDLASVGADDFARALNAVMRNPEHLVAMSTAGCSLVDGLGTARLVEALSPTASTDLKLRPAAAADVYSYFQWANDPVVRRQSLSPAPIPWDTHRDWFSGKLASPDSQLFVLMAGDLPVGQVRFDRSGDEAWIDYSLDRFVRGRGWASRLVALGCAAIDPHLRLMAQVRIGNAASRAVFARLGFEPQPSPGRDGVELFVARSSHGLTA